MRVIIVLVLTVGFASAAWSESLAAFQQADEGPTLEELAGRLQDANYVVRLKALGYIGAMKPYPKEIAPHVIRCLKDSHYTVRSGAAEALGNLQNALPDLGELFPESVPQLIKMLADRDSEDKHQLVRRFAAYALRHLGAASKDAVPALLKIAADKDDHAAVRTEAVQALGNIGHGSPEVVAMLTKLTDDAARINANYPTVGSAARSSLGRLGTKAQGAQAKLLAKLQHADARERGSAAEALATVGFGSLEVEKALLERLDDKSAAVQKAALSALEGINDTYAYFFRNRVASREVSQKQQALLEEIRRDAARQTRFGKILAAQVRLGEGHHPLRADALQRLVELDARDHAPMLREQFDRLDKKVVYLERRDLRLQLVRTLAAWLPDKDAVPLLMAVDADAREAPQVRFRAAILLCERGDPKSIAYIIKQHFADAKMVDPLVTVPALQMSLKDRQRFTADAEFDMLKAVDVEEVKVIQQGIQFAQHFYTVQQRGAVKTLYLDKVRVREGKIDSILFRVSVPSETWSFELRKKGDWWLPCNMRMESIQ